MKNKQYQWVQFNGMFNDYDSYAIGPEDGYKAGKISHIRCAYHEGNGVGGNFLKETVLYYCEGVEDDEWNDFVSIVLTGDHRESVQEIYHQPKKLIAYFERCEKQQKADKKQAEEEEKNRQYKYTYETPGFVNKKVTVYARDFQEAILKAESLASSKGGIYSPKLALVSVEELQP
jgi:hypothetical protein